MGADYKRSFPRCKHDYPVDDLTHIPITEEQRAECAEDAGILDAMLDPAKSLMGEQTDDEVRFRGFLGEQVFANICGVPRRRIQPLERCVKCCLMHGPADFPSWLDVKTKGIVHPLELMVNKKVPRCFERFAHVEIHHSQTYGELWIVAPAWRLRMAPDVRRGRHRDNPDAANWTLCAWALRRELEAHAPRECMICGPEWLDTIQKYAIEAVADMRHMIGRRGGKV